MIKSAVFSLLQTARILVLLYGTRRVIQNIRFLQLVRSKTTQHSATTPRPKVSVLVPARNEAQHIVNCVSALAKQAYPDFEVIVLDDQSTDKTGDYLALLAAQYPNVRVIHANESPIGWNGKSLACHTLAQQAAGEWLLFTDADTNHTSASIQQGVLSAEALGVELLSVFPKQITLSWAERLMVPFIMDFLPLLGRDLKKQSTGKAQSPVANGQYLLIKATAYHAVGGHRAIAQALVDDFALTHHMQACGYKTAMVDGTDFIACRMYQNHKQVWQGFSKNLLLGLETSTSSNTMAFHFTNIFILPFLLLPFERYKALLILQISWLYALRMLTARQFSRAMLVEVLTTPFSALGVIALSLNGLFIRKTARVIQWKDRDYSI